jgi:hypothetical protein
MPGPFIFIATNRPRDGKFDAEQPASLSFEPPRVRKRSRRLAWPLLGVAGRCARRADGWKPCRGHQPCHSLRTVK